MYFFVITLQYQLYADGPISYATAKGTIGRVNAEERYDQILEGVRTSMSIPPNVYTAVVFYHIEKK